MFQALIYGEKLLMIKYITCFYIFYCMHCIQVMFVIQLFKYKNCQVENPSIQVPLYPEKMW